MNRSGRRDRRRHRRSARFASAAAIRLGREVRSHCGQHPQPGRLRRTRRRRERRSPAVPSSCTSRWEPISSKSRRRSCCGWSGSATESVTCLAVCRGGAATTRCRPGLTIGRARELHPLPVALRRSRSGHERSDGRHGPRSAAGRVESTVGVGRHHRLALRRYDGLRRRRHCVGKIGPARRLSLNRYTGARGPDMELDDCHPLSLSEREFIHASVPSPSSRRDRRPSEQRAATSTRATGSARLVGLVRPSGRDRPLVIGFVGAR